MRKKGIYKQSINPESHGYLEVPVWVYEVNENDIFEVKFEYMQKGYKGLRFSDRKNKFIFD